MTRLSEVQLTKHSLARNTFLLSLGAFMNKGINFIMVPLFSSWLSTSDYGTFDLLCTYATLLVPFISLASSEALFRFGVEGGEAGRRAKYITTSLVIDCVGFILASAAIVFLVLACDWKYGICLIPLLLGELGMNHFQGVLRALKKLDVYSACNVVSTLMTALATTVFVLVLGMGLQGIAFGYALGNILGCIAIVIATKYWRYVSIESFSLEALREIVTYSLPLIPNNVSWWVINVSDRTLIGMFMGAAANGIYAIACKIPNFCSSVFGVFSLSWQETASDLVDSAERNRYFNYVFNTTIVTMLTLCAGVLSLNFPLFYWLFDARYREAFLYTPILVSSVAVNSLALYFGGIQISLKQPKENGITTIWGAVINVTINFLLIPFMGIWAAAISTLAANVVIAFLRWRKLKNSIHFSLELKAVIALTFYTYFFLMSYWCKDWVLFLVNLAFAFCFFCWGNSSFVKRLLAVLNKFKRGNN